MNNLLIVTLVVLIVSCGVFAEVAITIYNQDIGLVRETREFDFPKGIGEVRFTDVASRIIPTSVHFNSDRAVLLEQNYEYDLVDAQKLLGKYVDQTVELYTENEGFFRGLLLAASGDIVIQETDGSIRSISKDKIYNVHFPTLPEGLITRPTLVWAVQSKKGGKGTGEISYLTEGIRWEAEYVAVTGKDDKTIDLTGWTNITNHSGATYRDARIKLMAGDVQVEKKYGRRRDYMESLSISGARASEPQFKEEAFYEYHLYTLQRPSTLRDNQVKQISLFNPASVKKVDKEYHFNWKKWKKKVRVFLVFDNTEKNNLGIPLPKGKVRVYKESSGGGMEFIGEDRIDHIPRNEEVRISTGFAFDIVGEREELDRTRRGKATEYEIEMKVRNRKKETIEVIVQDQIWGDWSIIKATDGWEKKSASIIEWKIKIRPDEEKVLNYRVLVQ